MGPETMQQQLYHPHCRFVVARQQPRERNRHRWQSEKTALHGGRNSARVKHVVTEICSGIDT